MKTLADFVLAVEIVNLNKIRDGGNMDFLKTAEFAKQILPMLKIMDPSTLVTGHDDDYVERYTLDSAAKIAGFNDEAIDAINYVLSVGDWFFEETNNVN